MEPNISKYRAGICTSSPYGAYFKSILDAALRKYEEKTGKQLLDDPLATELKQCESVDAIKAILRGQAEAFQQFRDGDQRLMKWISPTVDVLCTFSDTLGGVAGIAFPPAGAIFTGIGVLLAAAKNVKASHDALVELFERIESFFTRLGVHAQVSLTTEMTEVFVKIVSEVLDILSIAMKEVKRKRARIYLRNLLGNKDIVNALARLDNLINEEVRLAIAQTAKDVKIANDKSDRITWNQIEQNVRTWFSSPDPSTNHNTACRVYHNVLPTWFFEAAVFKGWISKGSLLWVHGKLGSGKSVLCAAIIEHIMELRNAGRAMLAYFYFDFQDEAKQNVANALTSLLIQLSAYSDPCCDIVHRLYLTHGRGAQRPMIDILIDCLEKMLAVATQNPIFIIMDALDECPDVGMPTPREEVLNLLKHLVRLHLPNLHVCVTSRPEVDIQTMLKPLAVNAISLHEDTGQKSVVANYVRSVVSSDVRMRKWGDEDKELVIEELSKRADGMFQWVFCQLEMLRHAVQPDVRAILEELPETLDETYERLLKNINAKNRAHASRLLHCLAVAVRPLRVEELAEILAFDFSAAQGGVPKFRPKRRLKDQEEAVLSICSSLVTIVDNRGSRVVHFSHLSVKEFLTSDRLATLTGHVRTYHILPGPAHTILAQACLGLLLHLDYRNDNKSVKESPLAEYAARHLIAHAQFEGVASHVGSGVKSLFDQDKPHFGSWIDLHEIYPYENKANRNVDEITWNKIEQDVRKWISPPDPSTNHNTACVVYRNTSPTWLFEGGTFKDWMSNGSLLWVHGKPGSGKSTLCSAIIQYVMKLRDAGRATLAYFYFNFGDEEKRKVRNAVTSLLIQLSAWSKPCCDIIYRFYEAHGKGVQQPSYSILIDRLKEMLAVAAQHPIFVVMDALDECPCDGFPTPREEVLNLVKVLFSLHLPNLRICVTSRLEIDIRTALKPLTVHQISLHDQTGHKIDITNYISSVVSSDVYMKKWRAEDKELVVDVLAERADGMFQWVFCQLETLRHVIQPSIRVVLEELPRSLNETYARVLNNINENNQAHASRLLHCLAVSIRPLRVEELTEILALEFDVVQGDIPESRPDRWLKDQEGAVLSICPSLVTIDDYRGSRVVQFSHMSVKEFLTSDHLATSDGYLSTYRILPGPAHTIIAQACLGILLHLDDRNNNQNVKDTPLAGYAAQHWATHTRFEDVASHREIEDGMKSLFDQDKPHFAAWTGLYDTVTESGGKLPWGERSPLYYSALSGFYDLVRQIAIKSPPEVNAIGGPFGFPLVAALRSDNFRVAQLLLEHGGSIDARDSRNQTALHEAISQHGLVSTDAVRFLLEHGADVNAQRDDLWTPLHQAVDIEELWVAQILLDHGADVNSRSGDGQAPLHLLSRRETSQREDDGSDIAKLLLERGATLHEKDNDNATPLHLASYNKRLKIVRVLLEHGANADVEKDRGETPLHLALTWRGYHDVQDGIGVARLLLEHGAEAYGRDKYHISTSDLACCFGNEETKQVLPVDGGNFEPENNRDQTAFWLWIEECSVGGNIQDKYNTILLHSALYRGRPEMARTLLENGVKSNAKNHRGETALHVVSRARYDSQDSARVARLSIERRVDGSTQDVDYDSEGACVDVARLLLEHGADVNARTWFGETPLDLVSNRRPKLVQLLREHRAKAKQSNLKAPNCLSKRK